MHDLVRLSPETAVIVRGVGADAETERVACETLKADDRVIVNAGERIPGDGIVYWGEGLTDESLITGESELVKKERGAPVIVLDRSKFGLIGSVKSRPSGKLSHCLLIASFIARRFSESATR
jgi:P-type E1-E2 ATPase